MKSLLTFVGILAFNFSSVSQAAEFSCPLNPSFANYTCAGTVRVQSVAQLNAYKNDLGVVGTSTVAKAIFIDYYALEFN